MLPLALGIGFVAGLRSLTAPAAVSWAACYGVLDLHGTPLAFMSSRVAVALFSLLALAEYVADKLPRTPNRTRPGPLIGRIVLGGLAGASLAASAQQSLLAGAALGGVGAVIGAFAGYQIRARVVRSLRVRDMVVAVLEDIVALCLGFLLVF